MILFVDEESRHLSSFVEELRRVGYEVEFQTGVDAASSAWAFLQANAAQVELLILDVMMPPGVACKEINTELGILTGVRFFERARQFLPNLPVIILTNVSDDKVKVRFEQETNCLFLRKEDYYPFELPAEVQKLFPGLEQTI